MLEREQKTLELGLNLAEAGSCKDLADPDREPEGTRQPFVNPHSLSPVFNEKRDDLDAYIRRFERVASGQE